MVCHEKIKFFTNLNTIKLYGFQTIKFSENISNYNKNFVLKNSKCYNLFSIQNIARILCFFFKRIYLNEQKTPGLYIEIYMFELYL